MLAPAPPATADETPAPGRARRRRLRAGLAVAGVLAAVAAAVFAGPLLGRGTFVGVDLVEAQPPWNADHPPGYAAENGLVGDSVDAHAEQVALARRARDGDWPTWHRELGGGVPAASARRSPFDLVYLAVPGWYAPALAAALRLVVAAGLTYGLLRSLGTHRWPAVLGGVAFGLSGWFAGWNGWSQAHVAAFVPGLFWAAERLVQRRALAGAVPVALVVAAMHLGRFPAVVLFAGYGVLGYVAARAWQVERRFRPALARAGGAALLVGLGTAVGTLLAAPMLLPFAAHLGEVALEYRQQAAGEHLDGQFLIGLFHPFPFGNHHSGLRWWAPAGNVQETHLYAGLAAVVLACWALWLPRRATVGAPGTSAATPPGPTRPVAAVFVGLVAATAAVVFVGGPVTAAAQQLPFVGINAIGRARVLISFGVAVLVGLGAHAWQDHRGGLRLAVTRPRVAGAAAVAGAAVAGLWVARYVDEAAEAGVLGAELRRFVVPAALAAVAAVVTVTARLRPRLAALARPVLLVAVTADLALVFLAINPTVDRDLHLRETAAHRFLDAEQGPYRLGGTRWAFLPNTGLVHGTPDVRAHAAPTDPWRRLLLAVDPAVWGTGTATNARFTASADLSSPVLDLLGVRWWAESLRDAPLRGRALPADPVAGALPGGGIDPSAALDPGAAPLRSEVVVPAGGLRGVAVRPATLELEGGLPPHRLTVAVVGGGVEGGEVLASGARRVWNTRLGEWLVVPLAGDHLEAGREVALEVALEGPAGVVTLAAHRDRPDAPALQLVAGADDGLRVAFTDGIVLYERTAAEPVARFHPGWRPADRAATLERLAGAAAPAGAGDPRRPALVHDVPGDGFAGIPRDGRPGTATVREWGEDRMVVEVDSPDGGVVVVAQNDFPGWRATVDGDVAPVVGADGALQGVPVPAGRHEVVLSHEPRALTVGWVLAAVGALALALLTGGRRWLGAGRLVAARAGRARGGPTREASGAPRHLR